MNFTPKEKQSSEISANKLNSCYVCSSLCYGYYDKHDNESLYMHNLRKSLSENEILKKISGVEEKDPISILLKNINLNKILNLK